MNFKKQQKGFTLIELLVVIAIIGLLATLAVVALGSAREKSRDAKRVSDIKQVQTALELRFMSNDNYPWDGDTTPGNLVEIGVSGGVTKICDAVDITTTPCIDTTYMGLVPADPSGPSGVCDSSAQTAVCGYGYNQDTNTGANSYEIFFWLEGATGGLSEGDHCATQNGIADSDSCV